MVPLSLGAEKRTESNVLAYDTNSVPYSRTAQEVLSILYGTGDEGVPGAFFPKGANGLIAQTFIRIGRILWDFGIIVAVISEVNKSLWIYSVINN